MTGTLYIVGTPIGNLGDMSSRAVDTLRAATLILAEDTRHSATLTRHFGIATPLHALHAHNEAQALPGLLARLQAGETLALISDAGMPLISDPGFPLVRACHEAGLPVRVVPGPSAVVAALAVSGLPAERFAFEGFLPAKSSARQRALRALAGEARTLVFYEAPHRLAATLADAAAVIGGERPAALARELTKMHESVHRGALGELAAWAAGKGPDRRGEFVLLIGPAPAAQVQASDLPDALRGLAAELHGSMPPRALAKLLGRHFQRPSAEVYALLEALSARGD